ncbi:MAG: zinc ribbon domain-containing protein [Thermoproteales archaeon]|nr:zinc ribbon domain-containing protein [Thermoproteales archaeon]
MKLFGYNGFFAGIISSLVFILIDFLAMLSGSINYSLFAFDSVVMVIAGAILGFVFNIIEKPIIFLDTRVKAEGYGLIIGLLLGLNGRVQLLIGQASYNTITSYFNIPFIIDLAIGVIAGLIWGTLMGLVYWSITYRGKKTVTQSLKEKIFGTVKQPSIPSHKISIPIPEKTKREEKPIVVQGNYKVCPKCGTLNRPEAKFCIKCGYKLA